MVVQYAVSPLPSVDGFVGPSDVLHAVHVAEDLIYLLGLVPGLVVGLHPEALYEYLEGADGLPLVHRSVVIVAEP